MLWLKRPWGRTISTTSLPLSTSHALIMNPLFLPWCPRPAWWIPCLWLPSHLPCLSSLLLLLPPFHPPFLLPVFQPLSCFIAALDLQMADTLKIYIYLFTLAVLGHCCSAQAFSSCGEWGLLSSCGVQASRCGGFSHCRTWTLQSTYASVVAAHGLSCLPACGIIPVEGSKPIALLSMVDS